MVSGVCDSPGIAKLGVGVDIWLSAGSQNSLYPLPLEKDGLIQLINEEAEGRVWMLTLTSGRLGQAVESGLRVPHTPGCSCWPRTSVGAGKQDSLGIADKTESIFALN